jgi:hypothetical protein
LKRAQKKKNLTSKIRRRARVVCGMRIVMAVVYKRVKVRTGVRVRLHRTPLGKVPALVYVHQPVYTDVGGNLMADNMDSNSSTGGGGGGSTGGGGGSSSGGGGGAGGGGGSSSGGSSGGGGGKSGGGGQ